MGLGMIALVLFLPAVAVAVILAFWFAISAAWQGNALTTVASLISLLMILSPGFFASFATRPQTEDENPIFLIEYGAFPAALLGLCVLAVALVLRKRYKLVAAPALLLVPLASLAIAHSGGTAAAVEGVRAVARWLGQIGILVLAAYPVTWVLAFRELSEYVTPCLAKPKQG